MFYFLLEKGMLPHSVKEKTLTYNTKQIKKGKKRFNYDIEQKKDSTKKTLTYDAQLHRVADLWLRRHLALVLPRVVGLHEPGQQNIISLIIYILIK